MWQCPACSLRVRAAVCAPRRFTSLRCRVSVWLQMRPKPKDNLSKEMKQRLREEYYGIGGAENKVSQALLPQILALHCNSSTPKVSRACAQRGKVACQLRKLQRTLLNTTLPEKLKARTFATSRTSITQQRDAYSGLQTGQ